MEYEGIRCRFKEMLMFVNFCKVGSNWTKLLKNSFRDFYHKQRFCHIFVMDFFSLILKINEDFFCGIKMKC